MPPDDNLVFLRPLAVTDVERTLLWHNDPELYSTLGGSFRPVSRATEEDWLRRMAQPAPDAVNLGIVAVGTGDLVGCVYLRDIDWIGRLGELHVFIGDAGSRGRGLGGAACRAMVRHAFQDLGLQRVHLKVLVENVAAIRLYERLGFVAEGRLRAHVFKAGVFRDLLVMGLLAPSRAAGGGQ